MDGKIVLSAFSALVITAFGTPFLIRFSKRMAFYAKRNHRSSHSEDIPNTGGILLSFAVVIPFLVFSGYASDPNFNLLASAFAVLIITGAIDDFTPIPVFLKFLGQFIPAIVIVSGFDIEYLKVPFLPFLEQLPGFLSYIIWILIIVTLMNAYNLIDGIDGLAIGMGIFASVVFGVLFFRAQFSDLTIFAFTLSGGLAGLLHFNLSRKNKIFIGDTGSLLIGGMVGFFFLRHLNSASGLAEINTKAMLISGAVFIPVADMLRVILLRLAARRSPFSADRNHVHHILLDFFHLSHVHTTLLLVFVQSLVFLVFALVSRLQLDPLSQLTFVAGAFVAYIGFLGLLKRKKIPIVS